MVKVWVRASMPGDPGQQDANVVHFFMELTPEEVGLLGTDSVQIAAKIIAAQNYLTWLFSAQGSTPRKPLDKVAMGKRALKVFQDQLARAEQGGDTRAIKDAKAMLDLAKERLATLSG